MKINRLGNLAARGPRPGSPGRSGKAEGFLKALGGTEAGTPAAVSGAAPLNGVDALLALQEVEGRSDSDAQGQRRGADLLDRLEELRLALLGGRISPGVIERLAELAASERARVQDPRLAEILGEIELRAAVELAKLGR